MVASPVAHGRSPASRRKEHPPRPRGRPPSGRPRAASAGPPPKKRRYVPGGPGGGGRYVDFDGTETPVGGTGPGGFNYTGPRGRIGRENAANGVIPPSPKSYPRRQRAIATPRFSSAAAVAAAVVQSDGYKPREERGWEEFHPHLDIDVPLMVFGAAEVDGPIPIATSVTALDSVHTPVQGSVGSPAYTPATNGSGTPRLDVGTPTSAPMTNGLSGTPERSHLAGDFAAQLQNDLVLVQTPPKRRPGRPRVRPLPGTNGTPKSIPIIGPNPREKLTLPKPSFKKTDPFVTFERSSGVFVDKSMASVGYQESDMYIRPDSMLIRVSEGAIEDDLDLGPNINGDSDVTSVIGTSGVGRVEYDMDEQDDQWLLAHNAIRKEQGVEAITREMFEITMTKIEKEWHSLEKRIPKPNPKPPQTHRPRSSSAAAVNGEAPAAGEEQDSRCAVCDDGDCENTNAIVFCDGCDLAVHQECYGVPFIPEGQWLCRKCQLIGRGVPTCIFCPNIEGAFKQTNSSRWSHLLCAIWIPEVNLGNTTFMEPVMDVERVPKQRWKLTCYICRQKMGACIQCGNKNCFVAFHVTCARRARLFLKMKGPSGGPATFDSNGLKAYCDKHVPGDWRRENRTDIATLDAQDFYRRTMRNRVWADSQQTACAISEDHTHGGLVEEETTSPTVQRINLVVGGSVNNKRKKNQQQQPPKAVWRLPSGAPVIPQVVFNGVERALQRFMLRKRREYTAEACRFWTLKREARRGAALLKRLQLQMETFSSMEITRRNFAGMGAAGRVRLQRRIEFAHKLCEDVGRLRALCEDTREREREKLKEAEMLVNVVDTIYFPIVPLLRPVLEKAIALDGKGVFREGLHKMYNTLVNRGYVRVETFCSDLAAVFSAKIGSVSVDSAPNAPAGNSESINNKSNCIADASSLSAPPASQDGSSTAPAINDLPSNPNSSTAPAAAPSASSATASSTNPIADRKDKIRLAKRIVRSTQPLLQSAASKEAELGQDSAAAVDVSSIFERIFTEAAAAAAASVAVPVAETNGLVNGLTASVNGGKDSKTNGESHHAGSNDGDINMPDAPNTNDSPLKTYSQAHRTTSPNAVLTNGVHHSRPSSPAAVPSVDQQNGVMIGNDSSRTSIPWYLSSFSPEGICVTMSSDNNIPVRHPAVSQPAVSPPLSNVSASAPSNKETAEPQVQDAQESARANEASVEGQVGYEDDDDDEEDALSSMDEDEVRGLVASPSPQPKASSSHDKDANQGKSTLVNGNTSTSEVQSQTQDDDIDNHDEDEDKREEEIAGAEQDEGTPTAQQVNGTAAEEKEKTPTPPPPPPVATPSPATTNKAKKKVPKTAAATAAAAAARRRAKNRRG